MKRTSLMSLVAVLALGCGNQVSDKDRPFDDNNGTANNGGNNSTTSPNNSTTPNNGTSNNGANNGTANNGANNGTTPNNGANNTTANNGANNGTTPNNGTTNPNNGGDCVWNNQFFGQIGGTDAHGGGVPTPASLSADADLDSVVAMMPPTPDDDATLDVDEGYVVLDTPVYVSGAIVTSTSGGNGNRRFWIEDSNHALQVFSLVDLGIVRVGDEVSFYATELQNFEGHYQVAAVDGFTILSGDNPVPYRDVNNRALQQSDYGHVVRLGGTLGQPYDCGGTNCFDFAYPGGTMTFRSKSNFALAGACVQFSGPLYSFPGPNNASGTVPNLQMDTINYDWAYFE